VTSTDIDASRVRARDQRSSILLTLVCAWAVVPRLIQTLTAPKHRTQVGEESPPYTAVANSSLKLLCLMVLLFSVLVIIEVVRDQPRRGFAGLVLLMLPFVYLEVRDFTLGDRLVWSQLAYPAVVIAIWVLRPPLRKLALVGYWVGATAVLSLAIGALLPAQGIYNNAQGLSITPDKELLPGGVLVGIFTHGNNLGAFLVLGIPAVMMIPRRPVRNVVLFLVVSTMVWSAARSSLATLGALVLALVVLSVFPRGWRALPARVGMGLAWVALCALPLLTHDQTAFANRGYIWVQSLQFFRESPLFGHGSAFYTQLAQTSENLGGTVWHGHNQLVQLLLTGGVVLTALVAVLIVACISRAGWWVQRGSVLPFAYLIALAGACTLEVSLVFVDNVYLFPVVVLPLAVILFSESADHLPQGRPRHGGEVAGEGHGMVLSYQAPRHLLSDPYRG
jgi:hypothetical protein